MTPTRAAFRAAGRHAVGADTLREQLGPVRAALREDAEGRAALILAEGRRAADAVVAAARAASEEVVARARERAEATARARREQALATARRDVHRTVLEAEAEVWRQVADAAVAAAVAMAHDPRYPRLLDRLERLARHQLGSDAVVVRDPADGPGLVATAGARRVDYRLATLAHRAVEARGDPLAAEHPEVAR
jgi:vacuolar-type H+-ATPase subunit E/Vma4